MYSDTIEGGLDVDRFLITVMEGKKVTLACTSDSQLLLCLESKLERGSERVPLEQ